MDALTLWIAALDYTWLTWVAAAINDEWVMVLITLALVAAFERRPAKMAKIAIAVLVAVLLSTLIKDVALVERPCVLYPSKVACPHSYSFPSGHTIVAFTVLIAFLNKPVFLFYFVFAVFVGFTRIYVGVHSFEDVAGSVALAPFAYYAGEMTWNTVRKQVG